MRDRIVVIVLGLVAGFTGSWLAGRFEAPEPGPVRAPLETVEQRPAIVPPGWDPALVSRVAGLERRERQRLAAVDMEGAPPTAPRERNGADADPVAAREAERLEHYEKELQLRAEAFDAHGREPLDAAWAEPQVEGMEQALVPLAKQIGGTLGEVDCRSASCTAALIFPTPGDALAGLSRGENQLPVAGCKGYSVVPTPPEHDGRYELTVLYNCR